VSRPRAKAESVLPPAQRRRGCKLAAAHQGEVAGGRIARIVSPPAPLVGDGPARSIDRKAGHGPAPASGTRFPVRAAWPNRPGRRSPTVPQSMAC